MILVSFCRVSNGLSDEVNLLWRCSSPLILGSLRTNDGDCNGNAIRGHGVPVPGLDERALRGTWRERQLQNGGELKRGLVNEVELGEGWPNLSFPV